MGSVFLGMQRAQKTAENRESWALKAARSQPGWAGFLAILLDRTRQLLLIREFLRALCGYFPLPQGPILKIGYVPG